MHLSVHTTSVHCETLGQGAPVLLLHGHPDSGAMWRPMMKALAHQHQCLAPDLPGFGSTPAPEDMDYRTHAMARFVEALVQAWGPTQPIDVVAHDFGGIWALAWATRNPHRVRRIVLLNTVFHADYRWHLWGRIWRTPVLGELAQWSTTRAGFVAAMRRASPRLPVQQIHETYAHITPHSQRMALRLYRAHDPGHLAEWEPAMRALTAHTPTLVVWGDTDPYIPHRYADRFGAQKVVHLPEHGHWVHLEAHDKVAPEVVAFLAP